MTNPETKRSFEEEEKEEKVKIVTDRLYEINFAPQVQKISEPKTIDNYFN